MSHATLGFPKKSSALASITPATLELTKAYNLPSQMLYRFS